MSAAVFIAVECGKSEAGIWAKEAAGGHDANAGSGEQIVSKSLIERESWLGDLFFDVGFDLRIGDRQSLVVIEDAFFEKWHHVKSAVSAIYDQFVGFSERVGDVVAVVFELFVIFGTPSFEIGMIVDFWQNELRQADGTNFHEDAFFDCFGVGLEIFVEVDVVEF